MTRELIITELLPNPPAQPTLVYPWQIYPMRWLSTEFDEITNNQKVSIDVWREGKYKSVVEIEYRGLWLYGDAMITDAFKRAQEFQFQRILNNSPVATCEEPPSTKYEPCHCGGDCIALGVNELEPCWGRVTPYDVPDGEDDWTHVCAGHADWYDGEYREKP